MFKNICIFKKKKIKTYQTKYIALSVLSHFANWQYLKVKYLLKGNINLFCKNI